MASSAYLQRFSFVLIAMALVMGPLADPLPILAAYVTAGLLLAYCSILDLIAPRTTSGTMEAHRR